MADDGKHSGKVMPPVPEDDDDFADDPEERENEQLETSSVQRWLSPIYIVILVVGLVVGVVPFLILYTVGWMTWEAGK